MYSQLHLSGTQSTHLSTTQSGFRDHQPATIKLCQIVLVFLVFTYNPNVQQYLFKHPHKLLVVLAVRNLAHRLY